MLFRSDPALCNTRICMLTAKASQHDHRAASSAGADAYVEKPFKGLELMELVTRFASGELNP